MARVYVSSTIADPKRERQAVIDWLVAEQHQVVHSYRPLKPRRGTWAYGPDTHTAVDAAHELAWGGPEDPGDWHPVARAFRDGHTQTWYAADAALGWWGPDGARRLVAATADPATLPPGTWSPTCPAPAAARAR